LLFQQLGFMSHRMSDFRRIRFFRFLLPFRWFGLNFGLWWTPNGHQMDTKFANPTTNFSLADDLGLWLHLEMNPTASEIAYRQASEMRRVDLR